MALAATVVNVKGTVQIKTLRFGGEMADHPGTTDPVQRIMARCNPDNMASWKLLEKAGCDREGHFRQYTYFHKDANGWPIWTDAYEYSRVRK